jgi:DNA-3-methyladenine glycosylase II
MQTHKQSLKHLAKADPVMAKVIKRVKLKPIKVRGDYFYSLVRAIINQQLSGKAAETILKRFIGLFGGKFPNTKAVLKMSDRKLRQAGLSFQKISYIKHLARAVHSGSLDFKKIQRMADEEVIASLTEVKGIGRWTAEMFLMFSLNRPNVFSSGDLGLKNGLKKLYNIDAKRHRIKLQKLLDSWHPHKTAASRLLWAGLELGD